MPEGPEGPDGGESLVIGSGAVDVTDLIDVILTWGSDGSGTPGVVSDVDSDGVVGVTDLVQVILG